MENTEETQIITVSAQEIIMQQDKAQIDMQIATAKAYPRNVTRATNNVVALVQMDAEFADKCNYALKRGGKVISGPSVNLAKAIIQEWGNMRIDTKVVGESATQITSEGLCWDLEKNLAVKVQVKRSIMGNKGRYNDDMITVTGNAANSIALRNAVFAVLPAAVVNKTYKAAIAMITGDISTADKLNLERKKLLDAFKDVYKVTEQEVLDYVGKAAVETLTVEDIVLLKGVGTAIKNGDATVEDQFRPKPAVPLTKTASEKEQDRLVSFIERAKTVQELNLLAEHITAETQDLFKTKLEELTKPKTK